jgi:hypothetical protein
MPDEDDSASPTERCPYCGHEWRLHDEDGCLVATCDCTEPG